MAINMKLSFRVNSGATDDLVLRGCLGCAEQQLYLAPTGCNRSNEEELEPRKTKTEGENVPILISAARAWTILVTNAEHGAIARISTSRNIETGHSLLSHVYLSSLLASRLFSFYPRELRSKRHGRFYRDQSSCVDRQSRR